MAGFTIRRNRTPIPPELGTPSVLVVLPWTSLRSLRTAFWEHHRLQKFRGAFGDGQFGLQLGDATSSGSEFGALGRAQARLLSGIDELLVAPVVDRMLGDIKTCGDVATVRPDFNRSRTFGGTRADNVGASCTSLGCINA